MTHQHTTGFVSRSPGSVCSAVCTACNVRLGEIANQYSKYSDCISQLLIRASCVVFVIKKNHEILKSFMYSQFWTDKLILSATEIINRSVNDAQINWISWDPSK